MCLAVCLTRSAPQPPAPVQYWGRASTWAWASCRAHHGHHPCRHQPDRIPGKAQLRICKSAQRLPQPECAVLWVWRGDSKQQPLFGECMHYAANSNSRYTVVNRRHDARTCRHQSPPRPAPPSLQAQYWRCPPQGPRLLWSGHLPGWWPSCCCHGPCRAHDRAHRPCHPDCWQVSAAWGCESPVGHTSGAGAGQGS